MGRRTPALGVKCLVSSVSSNSVMTLIGENNHFHHPLRYCSEFCTGRLKGVPS